MAMARARRALLVLLSLGALVPPPPWAMGATGEISWALDADHESYAWRAAAGRPIATDDARMSRVVVWTRHKSIGIGNALSGYARVLMDALIENRTMVVRSVILRKFCEVLQCRIHELPGG